MPPSIYLYTRLYDPVVGHCNDENKLLRTNPNSLLTWSGCVLSTVNRAARVGVGN